MKRTVALFTALLLLLSSCGAEPTKEVSPNTTFEATCEGTVEPEIIVDSFGEHLNLKDNALSATTYQVFEEIPSASYGRPDVEKTLRNPPIFEGETLESFINELCKAPLLKGDLDFYSEQYIKSHFEFVVTLKDGTKKSLMLYDGGYVYDGFSEESYTVISGSAFDRIFKEVKPLINQSLGDFLGLRGNVESATVGMINYELKEGQEVRLDVYYTMADPPVFKGDVLSDFLFELCEWPMADTAASDALSKELFTKASFGLILTLNDGTEKSLMLYDGGYVAYNFPDYYTLISGEAFDGIFESIGSGLRVGGK